MTLDLVCLAILVLGAVLGALSGAVRQLFQLGVVVGAVLGARFFSEPVAAALGAFLPKAAARPVAAALVFVVLTIGLGLAARLVVGIADLAGALRGPVDRGVGALLSGTKAALTLWLALSAIVLWGGTASLKRMKLNPERSDFASFAREVNLIERVQGKPSQPRPEPAARPASPPAASQQVQPK